MRIVADPEVSRATLAPRRRDNKANKDGMDDATLAIIKANPTLSVRKTVELLKGNGIKRGKDWVQTKRYELQRRDGGQTVKRPNAFVGSRHPPRVSPPHPLWGWWLRWTET